MYTEKYFNAERAYYFLNKSIDNGKKRKMEKNEEVKNKTHEKNKKVNRVWEKDRILFVDFLKRRKIWYSSSKRPFLSVCLFACWGILAEIIRSPCTEKNCFVAATKLRRTNTFFVAATKHFAAATKRFVDRTKHFAVVTKYFCYPYFDQWHCWYNKTFFFRVKFSGYVYF